MSKFNSNSLTEKQALEILRKFTEIAKKEEAKPVRQSYLVELPLAKARGFLLHRLDLRLLPEVIISIGLKSRRSYGI